MSTNRPIDARPLKVSPSCADYDLPKRMFTKWTHSQWDRPRSVPSERQWTTESHFPCHFQSRSSVPAAPTLVLEPSGREGAPGLGDRTEGRVCDAIGTSHADVARHCRFHIQSPHVVLLN